MASPQETRQLLQEIANRGLVDSIPASKRPLFDEAVRRGLITLPETVDRTFMGQAGEFFRGIPRGAIGLLETAGVGASAMLPDEEEAYLRDLISGAAESAASSFQPKAGYEDSLAGTVGEAVGSTVPFVLTGGLPGVAARVASGVALGSASGAGTARTRAEQAGATGEERAQATALGILPGALEMVAPARIVGRLRKLENAVGPKLATNIASRMGRVGVSATEEGLTEAANEIAQNLIAQGVYDPEQGVFTNTGESFGLGAGVGGLIAALVELGIRDRSAGAPAPAEGEEQTLPAPPAPPLRTVNIPVSMTGGGENGVMRLVQEPSGKLFSELVDPAGTVRMRQPLSAASPNAFLDEMGKLEVAAKPVDIKTIVDAMAKASTIKRAPEQQGLFDTAEAPVSGPVPAPSTTAEERNAAQPMPPTATRKEQEDAGQMTLNDAIAQSTAYDALMESEADRVARQRETGDLFPEELDAATSDDPMVAAAMARSQAKEEEAMAAQAADAEAADSQDQVQPDMIDIDETRQIQDLLDDEELAQMQRGEDAQLAAQEAQRQKVGQQSVREDVTLLGEQLGIDRQAESARKRRDILLPIIEIRGITDAPNLMKAFSAELKRQGFADTQPTAAEYDTINRAVGMQEAVTSSETSQAENAAALQARQDAEQRAGAAPLESLIPERKTAAPAAPVAVSPQDQERAEKARLNRERLDRTGRGLEGQLEIPVIPRAKGTAAPQEPAQQGLPPQQQEMFAPAQETNEAQLDLFAPAKAAAPAAPDQGVAPQQLAFDLTAALDAAKVPKGAPVRNRVKGKTLAQAKPELVAYAAAPGVSPDVAESVTALADSIPADVPAAKPAKAEEDQFDETDPFEETKAERAARRKEEKSQEGVREKVDNINRAVDADIERVTAVDISDAIETVSKSDPLFTDRPTKGEEKQWLKGLKKTDMGRAVEVLNVIRSEKEIPPIELPDIVTTQKTSSNQDNSSDTIEIDGTQRPTTNSKGQPIADTEEKIRAFYKWFGDSKVVDDQGRPLVVYHGTTKDFFVFDPKKQGEKDHGWYGLGHYMTADPDTASAYSMYEDFSSTTGQNVLPLYASLQNPYIWPQNRKPAENKTEVAELTKTLVAEGYDGVIVPNEHQAPEYAGFHEVLVFQNTQIKSAIGNEGTFDPANPKINQAQDEASYSTDLSPYITDFDSAVAAIVKYASNPAQREIAQKLAARLRQLKAAGFEFSLEITPEGRRLRGARGQSLISYSGLGEATTVKVTLNHPSNGEQSGTGWVVVAHELAHAATQAQINYAPNGTAAVKLNKLFADVVAHFNRRVKEGNLTEFEKSIYNRGNNALENSDELLAWGLTSEPMQRWLDSVKSKNGSFLSRLFDVVSSALGFSSNDTALSELMSIADGMLTETFDTYTEAANKQGQSFGKQENTTGHPSWALSLAEGRPIVWAEKDAALVEAESIAGGKIYLVATPIGMSRVDVGSYKGDMLSPARLKEVQAAAAGMQKTSANVDNTIQAAESALTNQSPAANNRFLNVQGAQLKKASTPVKAPKFKRAVAAMFDKGQEAVTRAMVWGLGLDQINDYVQSYVKKKGPDYALFAASFDRFTKIADKLEGEMRQFIDGITAQIARMGDWRSSHPDLYEDMNTLVYGGTLGKVDLTKPKGTYAGKPAQLKEYERLEKVLKKLEPSGGAAIYRQMRAIYNRMFNGITQQVYDGVYSATQDADLATTIKNKFTAQMKLRGLEGYAALTRSNGKYRIKYSLPKSDTPSFETFENSADWKARQQQLLIEDGVNKDDMTPFMHGDTSVFDGIVPTSFVGDLVQTLKNKGASADVLAAVMELGVSVSPAQVVMERLAARKETPGYTLDAFTAFQESVVGLQRKLINMKYSAQMSKEVRDMEATRSNVKTDPTVVLLVEEVRNRAAYAANPNQNMFSNALTTGTYGWTLGGNVSSAIVDMLSLIVTGGYLSGKFGRRKAHAALVKAGRDILGMGTTADVETMVTQGLDGAALQEAMVTADIKERDVTRRRVMPSMLNIDFNNPEQAKKYGYLKALVKKVQDHGHSERFSDLEERAEFGESNVVSKVAARMGFMMSTSERYKRETGLKAYYDLALAKAAKNGDPNLATQEQMEKAADEAMEMSRLLNGGSTPVTGPGFQRDNFWRVAFMYRSFAFRQMYVQVKTLYDATLNDDDVVKAAARKFGSTVLLTSGALVGVQGMPLFGPVALLLNVLASPFVDDEEDEQFVQNMLRSSLDPLVYEGLPNVLLNMNVSERGSLTDLLARDTNLPDDASFAETIAAHFGGPAFGSIERGWRGVRLIEQGEIQRGVESMIPVAMSNVLKSIRFATDGAIETLRDDKVVEISPIAVVSQFMGFTPADYARTMEFKSVQAGVDRRIGERKSNLYAAAYTAFRMGDSAGLAQVMQKMNEFSRQYPKEAIRDRDFKQSMRTRARNSAAMMGGTLPRESRRAEWQEAADDWGVDFPE